MAYCVPKGKGPSIWDTQTHDKNHLIADHTNGDVACDSYHKYKEDVQLMKNLGLHFYRFSFSWSRILPNGHMHEINWAGIEYYNNLIDELLANNIQPLGTIYHWDLPQKLQDMGGWINPVIADYYVDYAKILFQNFGDRVKYWITFNEPNAVSWGYESEWNQAPAVDAAGFGRYLAIHTILKAHARVYHLYSNEFRPAQQALWPVNDLVQASDEHLSFNSLPELLYDTFRARETAVKLVLHWTVIGVSPTQT
ncbi:Myrosinase 1 [Blattella germanica]|nr:Myrosinase 1 [Blattella germanica]